MRLAVIADMHGNSHALEAILADAERVGVDAIAFLGDFVSDCADPEGVLALAREAARAYPCWAVRGNREEYQVRYAEGQEAWRADSRTGSLLYTAQRLSAADIAYFRRLPRSLGLSVDERSDILLSSAEKRSVSLETMPLTPFAKTTWRFREARLLMPPALCTRRKPCSSASSTTKPM